MNSFLKFGLSIFFLTIAHNLFAQTPDFTFSLKITDSQGNEDSVTIGYGSNASVLIDQSYGEADITSQPFDSVLDMRTAFAAQPSGFQSKTQITDWSCSSSFNYQIIALSIFAEHFPIILSWDPTQFETVLNTCHKASVLVEDFRYFNFPMITFEPLGMNGSAQLTLDETFGLDRFNTALNNEDQGEVRVYYFGFLERPLSGTVGTERNEGININLTYHAGKLQLKSSLYDLQRETVTILDIRGKAWLPNWRKRGNTIEANVNDMPAGLYTCLIQTNKGQQALKWVKN